MIITVSEFKNIIEDDDVFETVSYCKKKYINISMSFDIETTSMYRKDNLYISNENFYKLSRKEQRHYKKIAFMYVWQFAYKNYQIIGRKWSDFERLLKILATHFQTEYAKRHIVIYVHNLAYEFQFLKNRFNFVDVLALKERKPIKAVTDNGIEFRCSYLLSGYSLAKVAENLQTHKIKKLVGDLDYSKVRNCNTELTDEELQYCVNDVVIVQNYIDDCIERFGDIAHIPNTQTGIVRRYVKDKCLNTQHYWYNIQRMKLTADSFKSLRRAFQGGFTHGNIHYINQTVENVFSVDFTSSYPFCLVSEKYPISTPIRINKKMNENAYNELCKTSLCVFDLELIGVKTKYNINIIPIHKCTEKRKYTVDNGKLIKAEFVRMTVTNIDFDDINYFYSFDSYKILNLYAFNADYLPKPFIECVFKFYNDKTELKGVDGKETEYLHSKEMLNSLYGMCVTDIVRDDINCVDGEWITTQPNLDEKINEYNNDKRRFLYYAWGVFCTSYARHNLYKGLKEMKEDYIYCDTDSIKGINYERHKGFFDDYNNECVEKLNAMCDVMGFDKSILTPKTKNGKIKVMGLWDFEATYTRFKTLGAKRYLYELDGKCYMTVSGLGKKAIDYIGNTNDEKFYNFRNGLYLNRGETSKMTHTYFDSEINGTVTDFQGIAGEFEEKSFIHLENADFLMTLPNDFAELIMFYAMDINKNKLI